jgi:hypothetical protein
MAKKRTKKEQPPSPEASAAEPKAEINKDLAPGRGLEILKLSDIIPDGRKVEIEFGTAEGVEKRRYTLLHPGALSLHATAQADKLRARWATLFRSWAANECSQEETEELDEIACQLVPLVTDVPEETARGWKWRTRMQLVTLHFAYIAEVLPLLTGAALLPNRAVRRALAAKQKGVASGG